MLQQVSLLRNVISKTYIQENLRNLDRAYKNAQKPKPLYYFSKLAILELCGWIEVSMDDIILRHCNRHLSLPQNRKFVEKDIVKRTYGFDYNNHFRAMLIRLVGIIEIERIESDTDPVVQALFVSNLTSLKTLRDSLAHTYTKTLGTIDAPEITRARFEPLYRGLCAYDQELRAL